MEKRVSLSGFVLVLIGGFLSVILAINLLNPTPERILLSVYYTLAGAALLTLSFRIRRQRTIMSSSWLSLIISSISFIIALILVSFSYLSLIPFAFTILGSILGIISAYAIRMNL